MVQDARGGGYEEYDQAAEGDRGGLRGRCGCGGESVMVVVRGGD